MSQCACGSLVASIRLCLVLPAVRSRGPPRLAWLRCPCPDYHMTCTT